MRNAEFLQHINCLRSQNPTLRFSSDSPIDWQSEWVKQVDSTNKYLRDRVLEGLHEGRLFIADVQTMGRGRHGREWIASPGQGLLFSFYLAIDLTKERPGLLGHLTAISILKALQDLSPSTQQKASPLLYWKWPNDLMAMESGSISKLAGILVQTQVQGSTMHAVVGVGLNMKQSEFPPDLRQPATSLHRLGWNDIDAAKILASFCVHFERNRSLLRQPKALFAELKPFDLLRSRRLFLQSMSPNSSSDEWPSRDEQIEMHLDTHLEDGRVQLIIRGEKRILAAGELRLLRADKDILYFEEPKN